MIEPKDIELFLNLSQYDYNGNYYDFHNDYDCNKIILDIDKTLILVFKSIISRKEIIYLKFIEVSIEKLDFFNSLKEEDLAIDNLYRGKTEDNNTLVELSPDKKGYFYLEFYEGQKIEFWSKGLIIESQSSGQVIPIDRKK